MKKLLNLKILIILITFSLFLTACSSSASSNKEETIKIGGLLALTGPLAPLSENIKKGVELYFEQHDYKINDSKVELKFEDSEGKPQVALRKYKNLVDGFGADLLIGPVSSSVLYSLTKEVEKDKIIMVNPNAGANDLSWELKSDYIYRTAISNWQTGTSPAKYLAENVGKKVFILGSDYPAGHEVMEAFEDTFTAAGGEVVGSAWPKQGEKDFSSFMTKIKDSGADFVSIFIVGSDGTRFLKQYDQYGLKDVMPLGTPYLTNDMAIVGSILDSVDGVIASQHYSTEFDNEVNKKFVKDYEDKYGEKPDYSAVYGYDAAKAISIAIEKAGNKETENLVKVFKGLQFESPRGKLTIDAKTHDPVQDFYMVKNVFKDGKLTFEVLENLGPINVPEKNPTK
ncbi:ABC transporter substrate-binding protein [Niallia oryzisoli]|uniref:ABC transporter substrate-binding protein n=1 Tax=Niallia oryzisoli TaxID=1737571 RepID=UPI003736D66F